MQTRSSDGDMDGKSGSVKTSGFKSSVPSRVRFSPPLIGSSSPEDQVTKADNLQGNSNAGKGRSIRSLAGSASRTSLRLCGSRRSQLDGSNRTQNKVIEALIFSLIVYLATLPFLRVYPSRFPWHETSPERRIIPCDDQVGSSFARFLLFLLLLGVAYAASINRRLGSCSLPLCWVSRIEPLRSTIWRRCASNRSEGGSRSASPME